MKLPGHEWWCKAGDMVQVAVELLLTVALFVAIALLAAGVGMTLLLVLVDLIGGR